MVSFSRMSIFHRHDANEPPDDALLAPARGEGRERGKSHWKGQVMR